MVMQCDELNPLLDLLADDELPVEKTAQAMEHMKQCPRCQQEWDEMMRLRERFRAYAEKIPLPPALVAGIEQKLSAESRTQEGPGRQKPALYVFAALAVAAALALFVLVPQMINKHEPQVVAASPVSVNELVAQYTRSEKPANVNVTDAMLARVSQEAGFAVSPVDLPGWQLSDARVVELGKGKAPVAHLTYTRQAGGKGEEICCFQADKGQLVATGLDEHFLNGKRLCCGKVDDMSVVYMPRANAEYVMVSDLSQLDLLDIAKQS